MGGKDFKRKHSAKPRPLEKTLFNESDLMYTELNYSLFCPSIDCQNSVMTLFSTTCLNSVMPSLSSSPSISDLPSISKHISSSIPEPALRWKTRWWEPSRENISPAIPWKWLMLALFNDNDVLQSLTMPGFYRYFANSQRSPVFDEVWEQTVQMANNI